MDPDIRNDKIEEKVGGLKTRLHRGKKEWDCAGGDVGETLRGSGQA